MINYMHSCIYKKDYNTHYALMILLQKQGKSLHNHRYAGAGSISGIQHNFELLIANLHALAYQISTW